MIRLIRIAAVALFVFAGLLAVSVRAAESKEDAVSAKRLRVAVVTGGHPFNQHEFLKLFQGYDDIAYEHLPEKTGGEAFESIAGWPYDAIVLYNYERQITPKQQENFMRLLDRGVGLVVLHHANDAYPHWPEYRKITGVVWHAGPWEQDGAKMAASGWKNGVKFRIHVADSDHPITRGLTDYEITDETYCRTSIDPDVHVLLTTDEPSSDKIVGWTKTYRNSRVCYLQSGHDPLAYANPDYRTLVIRAVRWTAKAAPAEVTVAGTTCEYLADPLGIDAPRPRFTWVLQSDRRGTMQQAYRVLVARSEEQLAKDTGDLWDTGKVTSDESVNVEYQGTKLVSRQQCFWKVRVWDGQGRQGPWSKPARFEMGLLDPSDWQGRWIALGGQKNTAISPLLRKAFVIGGPIKRARLYAAGIGWSEYYLNGKRVGQSVLDPAATDYDKRILYVTHDVTGLLRSGRNALGATLGNGWYSEPVGRNYGDRPQLLLELIVELADGTIQRIATDESWRASTGPIVRNDLFGGEVYDARLDRAGWTEPNYDDSSWPAAAIVKSPGGRLEAQTIEPIKVNRVLKPVKLTNPKPGVYVYDFGQLFGGWARLQIKGPAGTRVALRYAAHVFPDTNVAELKTVIARDVRAGHATPVDPAPGLVDKRHHRGPDGATDYYILKGDPAGERYEPRFTFHPVRYVQVEGFPGKPALENLEGCVVHSSVDTSGDFRCSNALLNQIHRNCVWTFTNQMYGITLDCLYREHWGWLEPASNPSTLFARKHIPQFWTKFLRDAQCAQHPDGVIPDVIPNYPYKHRKTGDPAWAGNYPLVLWYVYQYYGDRRLLEQHYPSMKRWVDHLTAVSENHLVQKGYYGDHMLPGDAPGNEEFLSKETPPALLWTGYYYRNAQIVAEAARVLGAANDAAAYGRLAAAIRAALNRKWLDSAANRYAGGSQTANIFALALGIVPEANREGVLNHLIADIRQKRRGRLHTGNLGTACVMDAFARLGGGDTLYRAATATDYPGWGYMVRQGATTIWEAWGGVRDGFVGFNTSEDSMPMFMSIENFFYSDLAGIDGPAYFGDRNISPGFRDVSIRPRVLGDLTGAAAHVPTVRGIVGVDWKREKDGVALTTTIPVNARAKISIPKLGRRNVVVEEGGKPIWRNGAFVSGVPGITAGIEEPQYMTFDAGSGTYSFRLHGLNTD